MNLTSRNQLPQQSLLEYLLYNEFHHQQQAATTLFDNAKLTQKAYQLGEGDVQLLLLARRQALMAAEDASSAKVAALRSYYRLLVNAKLLWPDWLNGTID